MCSAAELLGIGSLQEVRAWLLRIQRLCLWLLEVFGRLGPLRRVRVRHRLLPDAEDSTSACLAASCLFLPLGHRAGEKFQRMEVSGAAGRSRAWISSWPRLFWIHHWGHASDIVQGFGLPAERSIAPSMLRAYHQPEIDIRMRMEGHQPGRIEVKSHFLDFDRLRCGRVTRSQRCLPASVSACRWSVSVSVHRYPC